MEVARNKNGIDLNLRKYTLDMLSDVCLLAAKSATFPTKQSLRLSTTSGELQAPPNIDDLFLRYLEGSSGKGLSVPSCNSLTFLPIQTQTGQHVL